MKHYLLFIIVILFSCNSAKQNDPIVQVHTHIATELDSLSEWLNKNFIVLINNDAPPHQLRESFQEGRKKYKKIEFAIEYFFPSSARIINGPPLPEIEADEHIVIEPGGFQVIEEMLYPETETPANLLREAYKLRSALTRVNQLWSTLKFRDDQVFEALRMECFRIITLGISGFDTPSSSLSISDLPYSLQSIIHITEMFGDTSVHTLATYVQNASAFANSNPDFNSFDRMRFITQYMNPISRELLNIQKQLTIPVAPTSYGIKSGLSNLFDPTAFNINYFVPDQNSNIDKEKIELGKRLFFDTRLSGNNKISCASCHNPSKAFTDGLVKNRTFSGDRFLKRNTPTLFYAGLQRGQFYDMRSIFLEDQVRDVVENKDEFHGKLQHATQVFKDDSTMLQMFNSAFGSSREINERDIQVALASFVRSLGSFTSRFDYFMRGDSSKMNVDEIEGFNLFMGKGKCGTCHFMPVFNGTVPPAFTFTESEVIGVPADVNAAKLDEDEGRYGIYAIENFRNAFKTPTVRNVASTAPYMHNGVYTTLDQVVDFYNRGGGAGLGLEVPNQTLPFDSLGLSNTEMTKIKLFMETLTDLQQ